MALKAYRPPLGCSPVWPHDGTWRQITLQRALLAGLPTGTQVVHTRDAFLGALSPPPPGPSRPSPDVVPFVVMQWVEGRPPEELLDGAAAAPLVQRLQWVADLTTAVRSLHSLTVQAGNALVHGDIKPANCLVDAQGRLVLLDLGAAVHVANRGTLRGLHTPGFAAPEVCADPRGPRTPASDLYSLGATAVVLLTGGPPPPATHAHAAGPSATAAPLRRLLHAALAGVPRSVRSSLVEDVLSLLDADPAVRRAPLVAAWTRAAARLRTRRRRRLVTSAVAAACLGGVSAVLVVQPVIPLISTVQTQTEVVVPSDDGADSRTTVAPGVQDASAVDRTARTVRWDALAAATPLPGEREVLAASFPADGSSWLPPEGTGGATVTPAGLALAAGAPGRSAQLAAPGALGASRESVAATVRTDGRPGMFGVWCRGTAGVDGPRYRFLVSHAAAARISEVVDGPDGPTEVGTGFWWLVGLDVRDGVTVEGRCLDTSTGVQLDMLVDGRLVLSYHPQASLGPSASGVEAEAFADVSAAPLTATFTRFADSSGT